jgi:hypothetical protein
MKSIPVTEATERFEAWVSSIAEMSPHWFEISRLLRGLVDLEGVTVHGFGDDGDATLVVGTEVNDVRSHRLWVLRIVGDQCLLAVDASTARPDSRTFLAGVLADAYSVRDVTSLVEWWSTLSDGIPRTMVTPLPHDIDIVADTIASLCAATAEATAMMASCRAGGEW